MVAWLQFGKDTSPKSLNLKGDVFVGNFYVKYNEEFEKQVNELLSNGMSEDEAKNNAPIYKDAKELLIKWKNGDKEVMNLWKKIHGFTKVFQLPMRTLMFLLILNILKVILI